MDPAAQATFVVGRREEARVHDSCFLPPHSWNDRDPHRPRPTSMVIMDSSPSAREPIVNVTACGC